MNVECSRRAQQKLIFVKFGTIGVIPSVAMFFVGLLFSSSLLAIGQTLLYVSVSSIVIFSRIGWSKNRLIDLFFNQLSIPLAIVGFIFIFFYVQYDLETLNIGSVLVICGFVLIFIGNWASSPLQIDHE
ncbi:MAG: hypothetical protein R3C62_20310 [Chloroflexota bacterium]